MAQHIIEAKKDKKTAPNLKHKREKHREMVKGIFKFYEVPGGAMSFSFREFKEDQTQRYDLIDGEIYSLPLGVAKHLNNNGSYPVYDFVAGDNSIMVGVPAQGFSGGQVQRITRKVRRFGFQSLEFVDIEDMTHSPSAVVTVESM
jgi:hypothetical protein